MEKDKIREKAQIDFANLLQKFKTVDEIAVYTEMMCIMCSMTINGLKGKEYQTDFLTGAINDTASIKPERVQ